MKVERYSQRNGIQNATVRKQLPVSEFIARFQEYNVEEKNTKF